MKKVWMILMAMQTINVLAQINIPVAVTRPIDYEYLAAPDSLGKRKLLKNPIKINAQKTQTQSIQLPYPIIFIHGLISNSATWDTMTNWLDAQYGFTYGGRIDFCLNYDGNNATTNLNFSPASGADIALYTNPATLIAGDYYCVNYDVAQNGAINPIGNQYVESNQAAVAKQGAALKWAIAYVLQVTGRDKVILMGHSMGGLASREYLQNPALWQADGKHHIAKLVTTGTPHGGSNASLSFLDGIVSIDNESEAVRDLRTSYFYSGAPGVYLFGGVESNAVMNDVLCCNFNNIDVNCNTTIGDTVIGLNNKNIDYTIDYGCITGTGDIVTNGDFVVSNQSANINNYKPNITLNTFSVSVIHTSLPSQKYQNMQGLDEPNNTISAYYVGFDTTYTGFNTIQATAFGSLYDYDFFTFNVGNNSVVTVNIHNIAISDLAVQISDTSGNVIGTTIHSSGASSITYTQTINTGKYYLNIFGLPTTTSYLSPYNFILSKVAIASSGIKDIINYKKVVLYPNPVISTLNLSLSESMTENTSVQIVNNLGQVVLNMPYAKSIDVSNLAQGVYYLKLSKEDNNTSYTKFIKQ